MNDNRDWIDLVVTLIITVSIAIAVLSMSGCTTLSPEERYERATITRQNWVNCEMILRRYGRIIISDHSHARWHRHDLFEIRSDIRLNNCRVILGDYWITIE